MMLSDVSVCLTSVCRIHLD